MVSSDPNSVSNETSPFIVGDSELTLVQPQDFAAAMSALLQTANVSIHVEFYILRNDSMGHRFIADCLAKARQGVQITIIRDGLGSWGEAWPLQSDLDAAGVKYIDYNPIWPPGSWWHKVPPTHRNHRKFVVVDDHRAMISTGNIGEEYANTAHSEAHWDLSVVIQGPLALELARVAQESQRTIPQRRRPEPLPEHVPTTVDGVCLADIQDAWGRGEARYILQWYLHAIHEAKTHILITNPYFLPHRYLRRALMQAARRGVRVELVMPYKTDWIAVRHAMHYLYRAFLAAGVEIHEVQHQFVHAKVFTVDAQISAIGSFNFDRWSVQDNLEANLIVQDAGFTRQLNKLVHQQKAHAVQLTYPQWAQKRSGWARLVSWIWWRLRAGL